MTRVGVGGNERMMLASCFSVLLVVASALAAGDEAFAAERMLGIAVADNPERPYDQSIKIASRAGATYTTLPLQWDEVETTPGKYSPEPLLFFIGTSSS